MTHFFNLYYELACNKYVGSEQRTKGTPGITGQYAPRVHIDARVRHLDVGSSRPKAAQGLKGWAVRPLKRYVI